MKKIQGRFCDGANSGFAFSCWKMFEKKERIASIVNEPLNSYQP